MTEWQQVGDVATEVVLRALAHRVAETDDEETARQLREAVASLAAQRRAA